MADSFDQNVEFLYNTMLHRDPKKRQVKLVERHLLQLDFAGLDDSSDDSDFEVPDKDSGEETPEEGDDDDDKSSRKSEGDSDSDEDSDEESADEGSERSKGEKVTSEDDGNSREVSVGELIQRANATAINKATSEEIGNKSTSSKKLKVVICCVCLGDISEEDDEIVECDGCGVSVHEGCYGISESLSVASTESSASTEPWFCDACKAGVTPSCELCPNSGGIYKETDAGKWVHIVCALYIPGVAFGDVDKLSPVTLFEMPYTKWGARACCLCEDERFTRTGVSIGCDAGMCRSYFHVTCAQKEGLLSEASPDEEIADPFYAYCKQHADKNAVKAKRRNWLAVQSSVKQRQDTDRFDEKEKSRVRRKLNRHREKYAIAKGLRPPHWMPTTKMPRMLTSCPSAIKRLMKKAELLGISTQVQASTQKDIRKKWHVAAALSVDFVGYYLDRNVRMKNMKGHLSDLLEQKEKLQKQERVLRDRYDKLSENVSKLRHSNQHMRHEGEKLWRALMAILPKKLNIPELILPKKPPKTTSRREANVPKSPPPLIHKCGLCHQTHDQHLLVKCDACKLHYHLGCLDPPLSRMPKKSKLFGWQCSECVSSSSDESDTTSVKIDPDAPRRLRETIKEPAKFSPYLQEKCKKAERKKKPSGKRKIMGPKKKPAEPVEEIVIVDGEAVTLLEPPPVKKQKVYNRTPRTPRQPKDIRTNCCTCKQPGTNTTLVRCDGCKLCYHLTCLDPPAAKTPKQRGYDWYCATCQDSADSEDVVEIEDSKDDLLPTLGKMEVDEPSKNETTGEKSPSSNQEAVLVKQEVTEEHHGKNAGKEAVHEMGRMSHLGREESVAKTITPPKSAERSVVKTDPQKTASASTESPGQKPDSGVVKGKITPRSGKRITDIAARLASKNSPNLNLLKTPAKPSTDGEKTLVRSATERTSTPNFHQSAGHELLGPSLRKSVSPIGGATHASRHCTPSLRKSVSPILDKSSGVTRRVSPKLPSRNSPLDLTLKK